MTSLYDMGTNNLLELTDGTYKVKEKVFVKEAQISSKIDGVTTYTNKETHTPNKAEIESLQGFQKQPLVKWKIYA